MAYVDGFVLAVPKDNLWAYKELATLAGKVWMEHGALAYVECVGDDVPHGQLTSFSRAVLAEDHEQVVFSFVLYPSKAARDAINARVMADPRLAAASYPFDTTRMIFGGFEPFLLLGMVGAAAPGESHV